MIDIRCPYCGKPAEFVTGSAIYPHRSDLHDKQFYRCQPCEAWVGCHDGTPHPLGRLANAELRAAKIAAHAAFDPLWVNRGIGRRKAAYRWLADHLGIPPSRCHIGWFDLEQCRRVVEVVHAAEGAEEGVHVR